VMPRMRRFAWDRLQLEFMNLLTTRQSLFPAPSPSRAAQHTMRARP
jgi:hypothetical protein